MLYASPMHEMQFGPGHLQILGSLLDADSHTISPEELASRALARNQVDRALSALGQELGNASAKLELLEYVVDDIRDKVALLSLPTLESLLGSIETYDNIIDASGRNAELIIICMTLLRDANQIRMDRGEEVVISEEGWAWIKKILADQRKIERIIMDRGDEFTQVYLEAVMKIQDLKK